MARRRGEYSRPDDGKKPKEKCDCGATLLASGLCSDVGLYPVSLPCPFVCPHCRGPLSWDGGCQRCFGSKTTSERATWTFPGTAYIADGFHRTLLAGPRRACSPEEIKRANSVMYAVLDGRLTVDVAVGMLDEIMEAHEDDQWEPGGDG